MSKSSKKSPSKTRPASSVRKTRKQAERLMKVSGLGLKVGTSYLTQRLKESFAKSEDHLPERVQTHVKNAQRIVQTMGEMKGTMMKLGQMLSLNAEMLPKEFTDVLSSLQQQAPPVSFELIRRQVEGELGRALEEAFAEFSPAPIAAASIGQVHRARLKSGRAVVVKVQYPGVEEEVEGDLRNIKLLLATLKPLGGGFDLLHLMKELRARMLEELDYQNELRNILRFREMFAEIPGIGIPQPVEEFSRPRVLTLEYLPGQSLNDFCEQEASGTKRNRVGELLMRFYFLQLFGHGVLHADPNPGNFAIEHRGANDARLLVYDFGCIKQFPKTFMEAYKKLIRAYFNEDFNYFPQGLASLGIENTAEAEPSAEFFEAFAHTFMEPYSDEPYSFGEAHLQEKSLDLTRRYMREIFAFKPPRHIVFHNRVLVGAYNIFKSLKATGYWRSILMEYLKIA